MQTIDYIKELRDNGNKVSTAEKKVILKYFGKTIRNEFTEQDVWEQARKMIFAN